MQNTITKRDHLKSIESYIQIENQRMNKELEWIKN